MFAIKPVGGISLQFKLNVLVRVDNHQPQYSAYLGSQTRVRAYLPCPGDALALMEFANPLDVDTVLDHLYKKIPALEEGLINIESQSSIIEIHANETSVLDRVVSSVLRYLKVNKTDLPKACIEYQRRICNIHADHAVRLNRSKRGNLIQAGEDLLIVGISPALFTNHLVNEIEKKLPDITILQLDDYGKTGKLYLSGVPNVIDQTRQVLEKLAPAN